MAGFKCAPLAEALTNAPTNTAIAQPEVMTIQPLLLPLVPLRTTFATTPSPRRMSSAVPMISPRNAVIISVGVELVNQTEPNRWKTTNEHELTRMSLAGINLCSCPKRSRLGKSVESGEGPLVFIRVYSCPFVVERNCCGEASK